jgi:tetratricopeptide (TPR) repeat protein
MRPPTHTPIIGYKGLSICAVFIISLLTASYVIAEEGLSGAIGSDARRQAIHLRNEGLQLQKKGDLDGAMAAYKKASEADPSYALTYSDMGIIHESRGMYNQAEQTYLKAVEVDPSCASAYSNLALLKEEQADYERAKFYWNKRAQMGDPEDPWTIKAKEKVYSLNAPSRSFSDRPAGGGIKDELRQQAAFYREEGLKLQDMGNWKEALAMYMKARELDPTSAIVYNDIGVVYENQGKLGVAEEAYLKAIDIDPQLAPAYSNLAMLYESQRDLPKALAYWQKRIDAGGVNDPWAQRVQARIRDIQLVIGDDDNAQMASEKDIINLVGDVSRQKEIARQDNTETAKVELSRARDSIKAGDDVTALKRAIDAYQLDPQNKEIIRFIEQTQRRLLSK